MNSSESDWERRLIEACQKGDEQALKSLYDSYSSKMYAICLRYMGNPDDAKDALQEGFIKIYRNIAKYAFTGSFEGWLKRIFVNTSIEQIRKRKYHKNIEDVNLEVPGFAKEMQVDQLDSKRILALVQELPAGYRTVFNMYCVDGYSHKEIAAHLGVSESTSKTQLFKARKMLQEWLKHWFK